MFLHFIVCPFMSNAFYLFLSLERRKGGPNSIAEKLIASLNIHSTNRPALGSVEEAKSKGAEIHVK